MEGMWADKGIREASKQGTCLDQLVDAANITVTDTNGEARCSDGRRDEVMLAIRVRTVASGHHIRHDRPRHARAESMMLLAGATWG